MQITMATYTIGSMAAYTKMTTSMGVPYKWLIYQITSKYSYKICSLYIILIYISFTKHYFLDKGVLMVGYTYNWFKEGSSRPKTKVNPFTDNFEHYQIDNIRPFCSHCPDSGSRTRHPCSGKKIFVMIKRYI